MGALQTKIENMKKQYSEAKERIAALDRQVNQLERTCILENGVKNSDGSVPQHIEDIEDDGTFQRLHNSFQKQMGQYDKEYRIARESLQNAEWFLVKCSIHLAPEWMHGMLLERVEWDADLRQKLIDIFMLLDISIFHC